MSILEVGCSRTTSPGTMTHLFCRISQPPKEQSWLIFRMVAGFQEKGQKGTRRPETLSENGHAINFLTSYWQKQVQVRPRIRVGRDYKVRDQRAWIQGGCTLEPQMQLSYHMWARGLRREREEGTKGRPHYFEEFCFKKVSDRWVSN